MKKPIKLAESESHTKKSSRKQQCTRKSSKKQDIQGKSKTRISHSKLKNIQK